MRRKLNKAQVGTTLTWVVAFVIIFVIMLLYLLFTGVAAKKLIPVIGEGESEIDILVSQDNLETQRKLFYLLNFPLEEGIAEYIETGEISEATQADIEEILERDKEICYLFMINEEGLYDKVGWTSKENLNLAEVDIFNQEINVKLYSKKC